MSRRTSGIAWPKPVRESRCICRNQKARSQRAFVFKHALRAHFPGKTLPVARETVMRIKTVGVRTLVTTRHLQLHTSAALEPTLRVRHQRTADSASPVMLVDDHARDAPEIPGCVKERKDVQADTADNLAIQNRHADPVTRLVGQRQQFFMDQRGRDVISELVQQPRDCGAIGKPRVPRFGLRGVQSASPGFCIDSLDVSRGAQTPAGRVMLPHPSRPSHEPSPQRARKKEKPRRSGAFSLPTWRREPESNRPKRLCRPLHNRFAIAPKADCPDAVRQATDFLFEDRRSIK